MTQLPSVTDNLLRQQGKKFSLMLQASLVGRDYIGKEEEDMIPFYIEALEKRLSQVRKDNEE